MPAFVLPAAAYVPRSHFRARVGHPMLLAVMLWALAHLLVSDWLHSILLFGSFLLWALLCFRSARAREPATRRRGTVRGTALSLLAWLGFAFYLHSRWIGVARFG